MCITVLLIGCGYGGLSIESSIRSIIKGIQNANYRTEELKLEGLQLIQHIEFVEIFEDRCLQCLYILSKIEVEEENVLNIRVPKKRIKKLLGNRIRIPMEDESDWWSRISIELHKEEDDKKDESALRFSCSTGRARVEQQDLQTSPEIIDVLLEEMSTDNNWSGELAKTIFELLIPNDFKDEIKKQSNTMWVLDIDSAAYPWELLQDSLTNKPLCCNAGMIRQLQTKYYRNKISDVVGKKALVVGDPDLNGFPHAQQLPGAFKEANLVASLLDQYGYEMPNNCFNKSSTQIIKALFKDEYKIIHLAGHGVFDKKNPKASGMLIGNGIFLSTREIGQMSKVPEMVFVNCCFLGKTDSKSEKLFSNRYKLAANIGTQLIQNGVKVVIAAGWAVDDAAALYFTEIFYKELLAGANFGYAIKEARSKTFKRYPNNNTWGAYQCYGDPFFKLRDIKKPAPNLPYVLAQEAENDLTNLMNNADAKDFSGAAFEKRIAEIGDKVDAAGIRNAVITEKEAMAYAECNNYEKAFTKFESLLGMEEAWFSVRAMEKFCNIRAKLCVKNWQAGIEKNKQIKKMEQAITDLTQLMNMSPTAERLSIMGSAFKRKMMIDTSNNEKMVSLMLAADFYRQAYEKEGNKNRTYALTNWLEIEKILLLVKNQVGIKTTVKKYKFNDLTIAKADLKLMLDYKTNADSDMDYWSEIAHANAALCYWLMEGGNTKLVTENKVVEAYTKVWKFAGSQNKKTSEIEHFDFLIFVYSGLVKSPKIIKTLKKIRQDLVSIIK